MNPHNFSAKTKKELANAYKISVKTLMRKVKPLSIDVPGQMIYPKQLEIIFTSLGNPYLKTD